VCVCVCVGGLVWFLDFGEDTCLLSLIVLYLSYHPRENSLDLSPPCILSLPSLLSPIRLEEKRTLVDGKGNENKSMRVTTCALRL
jgi:hypothetical protein